MTLSRGEIPIPLAIGDMLLIAERELGQPAEQLKEVISIPEAIAALAAPLAADPVEQAAISCSRIVYASLFPDANKRIGFECMCELLARAECPWPWVPEEGEVIAAMVNRLQAGTITEVEFVDWVRVRVAVA
jgi:prophage maintenance system killer protein